MDRQSNMDKTVALAGIVFLVITGFTAGSYYTMHKITETGIELPEAVITSAFDEFEKKCKAGEIITIKKKQYFCAPMRY